MEAVRLGGGAGDNYLDNLVMLERVAEGINSNINLWS